MEECLWQIHNSIIYIVSLICGVGSDKVEEILLQTPNLVVFMVSLVFGMCLPAFLYIIAVIMAILAELTKELIHIIRLFIQKALSKKK